MNEGKQIQVLEKIIGSIIDATPGIFLVEMKMLPGNNIKVFVDGDNGVSIDKLVKYNRSFYKQIEENGFFPDGDFSLEVSSPGLDEPLILHRQYLKNINRDVEVVMKDGIKLEGKMVSVLENEIVINEEKGKGKKKQTIAHTLPYSDIKSTVIKIKF
jgi:ribosome maturation factor RimP